jgi:hypothetical protein
MTAIPMPMATSCPKTILIYNSRQRQFPERESHLVAVS